MIKKLPLFAIALLLAVAGAARLSADGRGANDYASLPARRRDQGLTPGFIESAVTDGPIGPCLLAEMVAHLRDGIAGVEQEILQHLLQMRTIAADVER